MKGLLDGVRNKNMATAEGKSETQVVDKPKDRILRCTERITGTLETINHINEIINELRYIVG